MNMLQSMNRYVWVAVATVAMFVFSPRRAQDPLGAAVVALASGVLIALVVLLIDGMRWVVRHAKRSKYPELILAAADGDLQRLESAIRAGESVNVRGPDGETALMLAARNGRSEAVRCLLTNGADRALSTPKGSTATTLAVRFKHDAIARLLSE